MNLVWMLLRFIVGYFLRAEEKRLIQQTQAKGLLIYLKTINGIRQTLMAALILLFAFQIVAFSFACMIGFGLWLLPWELETKLWVGFSLSTVGFIVPFLACAYLFQEKIWYKVSQAEQWVDNFEDAA